MTLLFSSILLLFQIHKTLDKVTELPYNKRMNVEIKELLSEIFETVKKFIDVEKLENEKRQEILAKLKSSSENVDTTDKENTKVKLVSDWATTLLIEKNQNVTIDDVNIASLAVDAIYNYPPILRGMRFSYHYLLNTLNDCMGSYFSSDEAGKNRMIGKMEMLSGR